MPWPPQPEHLSEEQIELYVMGHLPAVDIGRVENHLVQCRECCLRVVRDQRFLDLLRGAIRHETQPQVAPALDERVPEVLATRIPDGREGVLLTLRQDSIIELGGYPRPGLVLTAAQARLLAARLELFAAEIECRGQS